MDKSWMNIFHFNSIVKPFVLQMVETSTTLASIPPRTSLSPAAASTLPRTCTSPVVASTPSETLTLFPQLPYSSPAPTSTSSSASSSTEMSSRPAPSSSARPLGPAPSSVLSPTASSQGVVQSCILILPTANNFNKQSDCAKVITEIMKAHFAEGHPSFGKVPYRMKNMWYTEFGRHTRRGGRRHSRTGCKGVVARGVASTLAGLGGEDGRGLRTVGIVCPTASAERTMGRYTIQPILGEELKANAGCLHIETGSPILTDE
ncbi:hypothetical protein M9H77_08196 [Catharanthus roseus]|uniref:Uncharacterized protein n=1 Tax=Catharanthus roseus TaxID=4058 RepID=A0ACC0BXG0_CATRO|nr:hypothetical protein M9H77_08196 [Catharanthus roseus]